MQSSSHARHGIAPLRVAQFLVALFVVTGPASAIAQSTRDIIGAAHLGSGYAQMLNLIASPDISSAQLSTSDDGNSQSLTITRLPYEDTLLTLSDQNAIGWRISGGYYRETENIMLGSPDSAAGNVDSTWSAFSATGGLFLRSKLGYGFTFEPGVNLSVARLLNSASYAGAANSLKPFTDGLLFNWHENAWLITPNAALEWKTNITQSQTLTIRGHVAWSWISSFDESDPVLRFREKAGSWSIQSAYVGPTGLQLLERPLSYVVNAGYGGFFGPNHDALGFSTIANIGGGLELPLSRQNPQSKRLWGGAAYLLGPHVRGWTVSVGLAY